MATKITQPKGAIGFRANVGLTIANGTKVKTATFTPEEADIHDISKEGLLITHLNIMQLGTGGSLAFYFSLFNRTSSTDWANRAASSFNLGWIRQVRTDIGIEWFTPFVLDLTTLPGGGVGLIADFITFVAESSGNVSADTPFEIEFWYNWVDIDSDSYRRLLYNRSI